MSLGSALVTMLFDVLNTIPIIGSILLSVAAYPVENLVEGDNQTNIGINDIVKWYTISDTVFGQIDLFDINFGEIPEDDENNDGALAQDITGVIKLNVAKWYLAIRSLTIVILLLVLIYIGIRMATSSLSDQRARYKKMLVNWLASLILVFVLHYIILFAIELSDSLTEMIASAARVGTGEEARIKSIEEELIVGTKAADEKDIFIGGNVVVSRTGLLQSLARTNGWNILYVSIIYWILIYYQMKFFFLYLKRFLTTGFLIVISPLITVTYSIDKAGDGKAQAFSAWMKEFLVNVFIQPLHAILYLVFMSTAYEIVFVAPILAIAFLAALSRGEKVIKELLHIRGLTSIHSMSESMKLFKKK